MATDNWIKKYQAEEAEAARKGKEYLLSLVPLLKKAKAAKLVVHYDGNGDEGSVQYIRTFANDNDESSDEQNITVKGLDEEKIDNAACKVLDGLGIDWYNNEGGYGYVVLTVSDSRISVEHNQRFESSNYSEHEV